MQSYPQPSPLSKFGTSAVIPPPLVSQTLAATSLLCIAMNLSVLGHFVWMEPSNTWPLLSWVISLSLMFSEFIRVVAVYPYPVQFCGQMLLHCITGPHFVDSVTGWWVLGCFLFLACHRWCCCLLPVSVWMCVFSSLGRIPWSGIAGPDDNSIFWGIAELF